MVNNSVSKRTDHILAPLSGMAVPLAQIPDAIFSQGLLGDGVAIQPEEGNIYAPVDGIVCAVTDGRYAYGFETEDGLEILVHVGIGSLTLQGQGFCSHVQPGDPVKAGDPVAEVDLRLLEEKGIPSITAMVICEGGDDRILRKNLGPVKGGETTVILAESK